MPMTGDQLRALFLDYFAEKGHKVMPSASLIPHGDPTLLLTTAGMVQFKPYFLGREKPPATRLTSTQKCFRTTDIDAVGDASHLTFFEMLGNFSVGDYFKKEAIDLAWEFVTERLGLPMERLWVTVFLDDDEAIRFWRDKGVPAERIVRLGEKDNFWGPAGDSGPCGPCSEIHYDFGEAAGCGKPDCGPACSCGRFCEIWNLVFMQFNQDTAGTRTPLPRPNIDTGMGLERLSAIMQGVPSVYQTDRFDYLLDRVAEVSGREYGRDAETDRAMRIVAEHSRGITFLIADGVIPSNESRGYVLRRLLRRTALFGRLLGLDQPFMVPLVEAVIKRMSPAYPELTGRREFIIELVAREESRFAETLLTGMQLLEDMMAGAGEGRMITGEQAFRLYDTYGFPLDLTMEIASGKGFGVDEAGFDREMGRQREKARAGARFGTDKAVPLDYTFQQTCFTGYDTLSQYGTIDGIIRNNAQADVISEGEHGGLVLDKTAFYAEMGGQAGDTGRITAGDSVFEVTGTVLLSPGVTIHQGYVARGAFRIGDEALTAVDPATRYDTARNHTATHLLQAALREVLGEHVQQRGSVVSPDRLRFDFSHLKAVTPEEIARVEDIVNAHIRENHPVTAAETGYQEALKSGVTALFGEKYGETVRVLAIGGDRRVSAELCGGTHIKATGEIGYFRIVSESSVGAGLRRIEAVTGRGAEAWLREQSRSTVDERARLQDELEAERRAVAELKRQLSRQRAASLADGARDIDGGKLISAEVPETDMETLRDMADELRARLGSAVIVLGSVQGDKPVFLAVATDDMVGRGYHAGNIIKRLSQIAGGGGGGKPNLAQGGGRDKDKLAEALAAVGEFIR